MTTEYTDPVVLAAAEAGASWADPETDPARIDWPARQAAAAIGFEVVDGRPVNPCERTAVRYGRNQLGHWGEQLCADALVTLTDPRGRRWVLLVERADGHGWALPGGYVDAGEDPRDAAVRELAEETGLLPPGLAAGYEVDAPRYVPDPRASDEAWMVTVLARIDLGVLAHFPRVNGSDDAKRATWVYADDVKTLTACVQARLDGTVFPAHQALLQEALG